jgi:hypothetical protein
MRDIARHRQRLEINLGAHDLRADVQQRAPLQARDAFGVNEKIGVRGLAERRAIAVGVLVDNVVADADVRRHWHAQSITCR